MSFGISFRTFAPTDENFFFKYLQIMVHSINRAEGVLSVIGADSIV